MKQTILFLLQDRIDESKRNHKEITEAIVRLQKMQLEEERRLCELGEALGKARQEMQG